MTDKLPAPEKPSYDAKGREVFSIHPEILAGGAPYRKVDDAKTDVPDDKDR
jgi:hypothetical protein